MENSLEKLTNVFQKDSCEIVSLMHTVMKYFRYEVSEDWYYAMGNGILLAMPFAPSGDVYFHMAFEYIKEVCYFSGAYYFDFITEDAKSFSEKIKEKWFEWADMQQAMPIIVGLKAQEDEEPSFFVLVGCDRKKDEFLLMDRNGELITKPEKKFIQNYSLLGFATIDIPNNFLVKSSYYRLPEKAANSLTAKVGYKLENDSFMMKDLSAALSDEEKNPEEVFYRIVNNLRKRLLPKDLFRERLGRIYIRLGKSELGESYEELGREWTKQVRQFEEYQIVNRAKIREISEIELSLLKLQKGYVNS